VSSLCFMVMSSTMNRSMGSPGLPDALHLDTPTENNRKSLTL